MTESNHEEWNGSNQLHPTVTESDTNTDITHDTTSDGLSAYDEDIVLNWRHDASMIEKLKKKMSRWSYVIGEDSMEDPTFIGLSFSFLIGASICLTPAIVAIMHDVSTGHYASLVLGILLSPVVLVTSVIPIVGIAYHVKLGIMKHNILRKCLTDYGRSLVTDMTESYGSHTKSSSMERIIHSLSDKCRWAIESKSIHDTISSVIKALKASERHRDSLGTSDEIKRIHENMAVFIDVVGKLPSGKPSDEAVNAVEHRLAPVLGSLRENASQVLSEASELEKSEKRRKMEKQEKVTASNTDEVMRVLGSIDSKPSPSETDVLTERRRLDEYVTALGKAQTDESAVVKLSSSTQ